ncbi:MAG: hypothetical protein JRE45_15835 [Deltaproteobacteria bacterium]|nr:hypothetical protein [Deltaproteobacteria bacterium]
MVRSTRVLCVLLLAVLVVACDGGEGGPSDAGVDPDSSTGIRHVDGEGGPFLADGGCLYYTEEVLDHGIEITATGAEGLVDEDGEPIDIPPGETIRVAPATICLSHSVEETTYTSTPPEEVPQRRDPYPDPPHLPCSETDARLCPEATDEPVNVPSARSTAPEPRGPFPYDIPTAPVEGEPCSGGMGFSFEAGVLDPWTSDDFNTPVYGNNVSVERLAPPGFTPSIESDIGGDYWEFSRDVNQQGNWWIGTADLRFSHLARPGGRLPESYTGALWSPPFVVDAPYLHFVLGGASDVAQRVELQALSVSDNDAKVLAATHQGIGTSEFPVNWETMPKRDPDNPVWVIVRSASALQDGEYMGRRVVWGVDEYEGRIVRFRIVDEPRDPVQERICPSVTHCLWVDRFAHVNADDFQCSDEAPKGTEILAVGMMPGGPPSDVGHVLTEQPLWGTTETHAHPTANISFGGHFIWGDVQDELRNVYNCLDPLHAIRDLRGEVVRPEIRDPRKSTACTVRADVVVQLQSAAIGTCIVTSAPLAALPFVGPIVEAAARGACIAVVTGVSAALASTPLITGHRYHGAEMPTSGAIEMGPMLRAFAALAGAEETRIPGLVEDRDFDRGDGTHSGQSFGQFHNHYQKDMIRRAWQGGMRLMVVDVHNGRALQAVLDARDDYDDWTAIEDHVTAIQRLVAAPGNPRFPPGALRDIAAIALSPSDARTIIRSGRIALILGVEVAELGKLRSSSDSIEQQVVDLHRMGIRKVTPIHGMDNPLGGTALFQDTYVAGNYYNNITRDETNQDDGKWESLLPGVPIGLPASLPFPFGGVPIGTWNPADSLLPVSCDGETCDCGPEGCPWNIVNHGYFQTTHTPGLPGLTDWIGDLRHVNYRLGMSDLAPLVPQHVDGEDILDTPSFLQPHRLHSLAWLLGHGPGGLLPNRQCSLEGLFLPLPGNPPESVMEGYRQPERRSQKRHFNAVGLKEEGERFLTEMMAHGMLLDTDHFSQNTRLGAHQVTERFRSMAGLPEDEFSEYPVFGVHTELRGCERSGTSPSNVTLRDNLGYESEISKSEDEVRRIAEAGGSITVSVSGTQVLGAGCGTLAGPVISNNCDFSSKSYARKYLTAVDWMGGHGATPGFDMNGFAPGIASRFGAGNACRRIIDKRQYAEGGFTPATPEEDLTHLALWPRDWVTRGDPHGPFAELCEYNGSMQSEFWSSECPSTQMLQAQLQEFSGVIYEDYDDQPTWDTIPWLTAPDENRRVVIARQSWQLRDDGAERPLLDEAVAVGGGGALRQIRPLVKWKNDNVSVPEGFNTGWDVNLDGMQHIGLFPDLIQDMRNGGVTWELLTPMFNAAEDFVRMWEKTCTMANAFRSENGLDPLPDCE